MSRRRGSSIAWFVLLASAIAPACSLILPFDSFVALDAPDAAVDVSDPARDALEDVFVADTDAADDSIDAMLDAIDDALDASDDALDATTDSPLDATTDSPIDATADATIDATVDASIDATVDASIDATSDGARDAGTDSARDATADRAGDVLTDAPPDACPSIAVTCTPAASCVDHLAQGRTANGFYYVDHDGRPDTAPLLVECDMSLGGWTRLFRINGSNGCPGPLRHIGTSRVCVRPMVAEGSITSLAIPNFVRYREVQARVALLGFAGVDAFGNPAPNNTWSTYYVDGLSLFARDPGATSPRHVWTWALAGIEAYTDSGVVTGAPCPCNGGPAPVVEIGRSYLCAATLTPLAAMTPLAWRDPITAWVTSGLGGACAMGDPAGRFFSSSTSDSTAPFEVRLIVSGASFDAPTPGEDVGIRDFDLLVR